jgi:hypothetical protein
VVQRFVLEEGHVEFVRHQRLADVARQAGMAQHRRQVARAAALVGHLPLLADAQREGRVVVEEEGRHVVVVDHQQDVRLLSRPATA